MMHLYLVERKDGDRIGYDETLAVVVNAATSREARDLAATQAGDEGADAWRSTARTRCTRLVPTANPRVILRSFNAG